MSEFLVSNRGRREEASFYMKQDRGIDAEAERLQSAAVRFANPVSERVLESHLDRGDVVLDIGAGADAALGRRVEGRGLRYLAVEPNRSFVSILQKAGIDAYQGDVANMPIEPNSVDAVHTRFVFGWLNEEQRKLALKQAVRVLKASEPTAIAVIDYDWLMADGPAEYMEAVGAACDVLGSFGFDYAYGSKLSADIEELASEGVFAGAEYEVLPAAVDEINVTLGSGLSILEEAVDSLKEGLNMLGDTDRANAIDEALNSLRNIDPDAKISLPGIVTQVVSVMKHEPSQEISGSRVMSSEYDKEYGEDYIPASVPGVAKIKVGSPLDSHIRRVQAYEYLKEGMLTSESMINESGVLCEESYPEDVVRRSLSFAAMSTDTKAPLAAVRLIEVDKDDDPDTQLRSLPTAKHLGLRVDDLPEGVSAGDVIEVSAFVRNSKEGGGLMDMARVIIGAAAEAKEQGYHTGLMTTQKSAWKFLKGIFGEENFTVLEDLHVSDIPGASQDIEFICLSVDVQSFLEGVRAHALKKKDNSKILSEVHSILGEYYGHQQAA